MQASNVCFLFAERLSVITSAAKGFQKTSLRAQAWQSCSAKFRFMRSLHFGNASFVITFIYSSQQSFAKPTSTKVA